MVATHNLAMTFARRLKYVERYGPVNRIRPTTGHVLD